MEAIFSHVKIRVHNGDQISGCVTAWLPAVGSSEVEFDHPITGLNEDDLIELLRICRKARRMYAAADKLSKN